MKKQLTTEEIESIANACQTPQTKGYTPRPKWHCVFAMVLAVIVVLAFLGTCYWMMFGRF